MHLSCFHWKKPSMVYSINAERERGGEGKRHLNNGKKGFAPMATIRGFLRAFLCQFKWAFLVQDMKRGPAKEEEAGGEGKGEGERDGERVVLPNI